MMLSIAVSSVTTFANEHVQAPTCITLSFVGLARCASMSSIRHGAPCLVRRNFNEPASRQSMHAQYVAHACTPCAAHPMADD